MKIDMWMRMRIGCVAYGASRKFILANWNDDTHITLSTKNRRSFKLKIQF